MLAHTIEVSVSPQKIVRVTESRSIDLEGPGYFKVSKGDEFFASKAEDGSSLYCGYKHHHVDRLKTLINQGCVSGDSDAIVFDKYYVRTDSLDVNVLGFLYYDALVANLIASEGSSTVPYELSEGTPEHKYDVAFRFEKISTRKGDKYIEFNIYSKPSSSELWRRFVATEPVTVVFPKGETEVIFNTPMFSVKLSNPTNKSFTAEVLSIETQGHLGFERTAVNSADFGYKPAYQISQDKL